MEVTLEELAAQVGGEIHGDRHCLITGIGSLESANPGDITFLSDIRFGKYLKQTAASAVILSSDNKEDCPVNALVVDNPYAVYARIAQILYPGSLSKAGIHPSSCVGENCNIDKAASIGPHCVIGPDVDIAANVRIGPGCIVEGPVQIGADSRLVGNVVIYPGTRIGKRALIHAGAMIGGDGFGFANDQDEWIKIPQLGGVLIGDDVEIGANTTIDRGALDDTVLGNGVKLDNQIQIAHNVQIGEHTAIAACTGIAGSTAIGRRCAIGGGVGIIGHLEISDDVHITATTFISKSIKKAGLYSSGTPVEENHLWRKNVARMKQLDELSRRVKALEATLQDKGNN